jgi:hypothetical protein
MANQNQSKIFENKSDEEMKRSQFRKQKLPTKQNYKKSSILSQNRRVSVLSSKKEKSEVSAASKG